MTTKKILVLLACSILLMQANAQTGISKKLISFGWNYPSVNYLLKSLPQMEQYPFDGVCFSLQKDIIHAFDTGIKTDAYFLYDFLPKIEWKQFTDNFIVVWGCGNAGGSWFDDAAWANIENNLKKTSKAVSISRAKGIFFDPEYYLPDPKLNPWKYSAQSYPNKDFAIVAAKVKERGCQFMKAIQYYKPDIKIFCTWLLGLAIEQRKNNSLPNIDQALLPAFIEGMLEAKNKEAVIIDGNETAYWYDKATDFFDARQYLQKNGITLLSTNKDNNYAKVQIAQAVYADGLLAKLPEFEKGYDSITKHQWLYNNILYALASSDEYAWFYTERVALWDGNQDKEVKAILINAKEKLRSGKARITPELLKPNGLRKTNNSIKNNALFIPKNNEVLFNFIDDIPDTIKLYKNSYLLQTITKNTKRQLTIKFAGTVKQSDNLEVVTITGNYFTAPKKSVTIIY